MDLTENIQVGLDEWTFISDKSCFVEGARFMVAWTDSKENPPILKGTTHRYRRQTQVNNSNGVAMWGKATSAIFKKANLSVTRTP